MVKKKASKNKVATKRAPQKAPAIVEAAVPKATSVVHKFVGLQAPMHVWHEVYGEACCTALRFGAGTSDKTGALNLAPGSDYEVSYSVDPKKKTWSLHVVQTSATVPLGTGVAKRDGITTPPPPVPPLPPPPSPLPPLPPPPPPPPPPSMCFCLESGLSRVCQLDQIPLCTSNTIECIFPPGDILAPAPRGRRAATTRKAKAKKRK